MCSDGRKSSQHTDATRKSESWRPDHLARLAGPPAGPPALFFASADFLAWAFFLVGSNLSLSLMTVLGWPKKLLSGRCFVRFLAAARRPRNLSTRSAWKELPSMRNFFRPSTSGSFHSKFRPSVGTASHSLKRSRAIWYL